MVVRTAITTFLLMAICNYCCHAFQPAFNGYRHQIKPARASSARRSSTVDEEDVTFFARASRQAAKERSDNLLSGDDPFGLFRGLNDEGTDDKSSNAVDVVKAPSENIIKSSPEIISDQMPSSSSIQESEVKDSNQISDLQYSELLSNLSPSTGESTALIDNNMPQSTGDEYKFHKRLMESRFAIENKNNQVAGQPGCIRKSDDGTADDKITYRNRDELNRSLYPDKLEVQEEAADEAISDTHASTLAETDDAQADAADIEGEEYAAMPLVGTNEEEMETDGSPVNEENVAMGLMVLTRSFFTLKQIVDSRREQIG